jgi:hypothetical protein
MKEILNNARTLQQEPHRCTMPLHGQADAPHACCRPAERQSSAPSAKIRFWDDARIWKRASQNTLNCLIGCSIGDFGMIIYLQAFHPQTPMLITIILAMSAGLVTSILFETALLHWREHFPLKTAVATAFSMSFLSMVAMELVSNTTDFMLTGGRVPVSDPFYWQALGLALIAGFLAPLPYNYYQLKKHGRACH